MRARRLLLATGSLLIGGLGAAWGMNLWIKSKGSAFVYRSIEQVPGRQIAIVPGARVLPNGRPSSVLEDRLMAAKDLYDRRLAARILVSGDHLAPEYDEVNAMHRWLVDHGVPEEDIFLDHAGLRTLDTMERAARVFGVEGAIICTQRFHLDRAVFLARRAGIDAVGLEADRRTYQTARWNETREFVARTRAFLDSYVLESEPTHLGDPIAIDGDSSLSHDPYTRR